MTPHENITEGARHDLANCKSAFRLLQGALLCGKIAGTDSNLKAFEQKIMDLETRRDGSAGTYDASDPKWSRIQRFFDIVPGLVKEVAATVGDLPELPATAKKLLIIDDLVEEAGWKDVFSAILGKDKLLTATSREEAEDLITKHVHDIFSVFVDIHITDRQNFDDIILEKEEGMIMITEFSTKYPHLPLVAFTAYDSSIVAKMAFENGAWDYFTKEPVGFEAKHWRNEVEYFKGMMLILSRHILFSRQYPDLFNMVTDIVSKLENKISPPFHNLLKKNLYNAYKYLSVQRTLRFSPVFLEIDRWEEVVFQSTKALDSFCACILERHKIYPHFQKNEIPRAPTLGQKRELLEQHNSILQFKNNWFDRCQRIVQKRNRNTHQEKIVPLVKHPTNPEFTYEPYTQKFTEEEAIDFLNEILQLMNEGIKAF